MPRVTRIGALVVTALLGTAAAARAQVVVGPRAASIAVAPGAQVTVPIVADMTGGGGVSLGSLTARLAWRPGTLRYDGVAVGTFGTPVVNADSATGILRLAAANPAGATGEVVVLHATFTGIGVPGDTTTLAFTVDEMTAAGTFASIARVATGSLVCVGTASGRWGDLDGDDALTSFDALLIVTNAVGLSIAPYTAGAGDVDADGDSDTRDALIVLSNVVGLPTPGFRPGQSIGASCGGNPPAAVTVSPAGLSLVVGDTVPATAVARDTAGQIVSVPGLQWTTLDALVATVTPSGRIAAVGPGVTGAVAVVAPGVMDTIGVTVVTTRTSWYVDAATSAGQPSQTGSPAYPFETLQLAVDRAAAGDTVLVRGGTYPAGALSTKPLTIVGETGYPLPRFGGPIVFDGIGAATVRLRRLVVADASEGIRAHGAGGGVVLLDSVAVERAVGHGIDVAVFDSLGLTDVAVSGARDKGIVTDSVRGVAFARVNVDAVVAASGTGTGRGVSLARAATFAVDSGRFRLGDVVLDSVLDVRLHRVQVAESYAGLFTVVGALAIDLDSVLFRMGGDVGYGGFAVSLDLQPGGTVTGNDVEIREIAGQGLAVSRAAAADFTDLRVFASGRSPGEYAAAFPDVGRVRVHRGAFQDGQVWHADALQAGAQVLQLDSVDFRNAGLSVAYLDTVAVRQAWFDGAPGGSATIVGVDSVRVVSLVGVEVRNGASDWTAISISLADSLRADSLYVHDNYQGLYVNSVRTVTMTGSRFERNSLNGYSASVVLYAPVVRIAHSVFEQPTPTSNSVEWYGFVSGMPQSIVVDTSVFRGSATAIYAQASYNGAVTVRGSSLGRGPGGYGRQLLYFSVPGRVRVLDGRVDSTDYGYYAIQGYADTVDVLDTQLDFVGSGLYVSDWSGTGLPVTITNNVIACRPGGGGNYYGIRSYGDSTTITGNTVTRCWGGIWVGNSVGRHATIRSNSVTDLDSTNGQYGIYLYGTWSRPVIAQNTIARGRATDGAIGVYGWGTGIDTARVDSNTVQDILGWGINARETIHGLHIRGNVIERQGNLFGGAAISLEGVSGTDTLRITDNRLRQNTALGMYLNTAAPVRIDTNVVVDDSLTAIKIENNTPVVGRGNFLARNGEGLYAFGTITIDSSVIQQSVRVGARYSGGVVTLANNYWGDSTGPRCDTGCVGALGDSLVGAGSLNYVPFLTSAPSTPTGAPPVQRAGAALLRPAPAIRLRAAAPAWFEERRRALRARWEGDR